MGSPYPWLANAGSRPQQLFGLMENEEQRSRATARAFKQPSVGDDLLLPWRQTLWYCLPLTPALKPFLTDMVIIQASGQRYT